MKTTEEIISMPRVAYSLIRWSDGPQGEGHSKKRQEGFAPRWCQAHEVRLDDSMSMVLDGESAFRGHHRRPGKRKVRALADFLESIRVGKVAKGSILIIENLDRLSREDIDEAWEFFRSILKAGVDVVTESPERHYTKESLKDLFSILEVKFIMYRAHDESLQKSRRLRKVWQDKKEQARSRRTPQSARCPAWLELKNGEYRIIAEREAVIRRMIDFSLKDNYGARRIASILTQEKVPCFGWSGEWTCSYVHIILTSPGLYGVYEPTELNFETGATRKTGEQVAGYYPPIATEEEWIALQHARKMRKRSSGRPDGSERNLFTGMLYDADSRERMHLKVNGPCVYLAVYRGPKKISTPYYPLRDLIIRTLDRLKAEDVLPPSDEGASKLQRLSDLTREVHALTDRLAVLESQQNDPETDPDLLKSVQRGIVEVARRRRERAKQLRELEEQVDTNQTKSLGACQSALEYLDTPERRRMARNRIRQLVHSIYVYIQRLNRKKSIVHVQMYLVGGRRLYRQLIPADLPFGVSVWQLGDCDFRAGNVGDAASAPQPSHVIG